MKVPKAIQNLVENFEKLPGVGPKTAQRLTYYLLHVPQAELDRFSDSLANLKKDTVLCSICNAVDETDPCSICGDATRDHSVICVVEQPLDVLALEKGVVIKACIMSFMAELILSTVLGLMRFLLDNYLPASKTATMERVFWRSY